MDNLRGAFDSSDLTGDDQDWDAHEEEETSRELPPEAIGQDERRMQVRAYNHWASLLGENTFPSIEDLEPHNLDDFGPNSVLLDFSSGIEDPAVQFLGTLLAEECGAETDIARLSDVPPRSLLSRITDHYMQILANEAPIGFEAEFVNQRGTSIMYRGILLPFSSNNETIDFIYGVINWKEMADQVTSDELLLEIDQALEADELPVEDEDEPQKHHADPVTEWADSPAAETGADGQVEPVAADLDDDVLELSLDAQAAPEDEPTEESGNVASLAEGLGSGFGDSAYHDDLPTPDFGQYGLDDPEDEDEEEDGANYSFASLSDYLETPAKKAVDLDADKFDPADYQVEDEEEDDVVDELSIVDPVEDRAQDYLQGIDFAGEAGSFEENEPENASGEDADIYEASEEYIPDATDALAGELHGEHETVEEPAEEPIAEEDVANEPEPVVEAAPEPQAEPEPEPVVELEPTIAAVASELALDELVVDDEAGLYDCLASARELAENARNSEDRSRTALYAAVSRAYDFSLAAKDAPEDYDELIEESGLTKQDRAPMTPVVKLVFGSDYDKTRITEYAAVLSHAHRLELERGALADFLSKADGGLKGVVKTERRLRKEEAGKTVEPENEVRRALAKKLRELEAMTFDALSADGAEFSLVMVRRDGEGGLAMVGEIDSDIPLIERAAKKLVG